MNEQEPTAIDSLYLEAKHFALIAESQPPLEPRERVVPMGQPRRPFPGLIPREDSAGLVRPDDDGPDCRRCGKPSGKWWLIDAGTDAEHRMLCPDCDAAATQQMLRLPERPASSEEKTT